MSGGRIFVVLNKIATVAIKGQPRYIFEYLQLILVYGTPHEYLFNIVTRIYLFSSLRTLMRMLPRTDSVLSYYSYDNLRSARLILRA